jgi:hypothetical protein
MFLSYTLNSFCIARYAGASMCYRCTNHQPSQNHTLCGRDLGPGTRCIDLAWIVRSGKECCLTCGFVTRGLTQLDYIGGFVAGTQQASLVCSSSQFVIVPLPPALYLWFLVPWWALHVCRIWNHGVVLIPRHRWAARCQDEDHARLTRTMLVTEGGV